MVKERLLDMIDGMKDGEIVLKEILLKQVGGAMMEV